MYHYQAFGLAIQSELAFPDLLSSTHIESNVLNRITIQFGQANPIDFTTSGLFYQVSDDALWLNVPNIARFLVIHGKQIIINPVSGIDEDSIRLFILGFCMGALLIQRHLFLLRGNAVKIEDYCISFVGHSGVGKSTLAGALLKRGYSILADDICAINTSGHVIPSFPQIKLWSDAAEQLNIATQHLRKIRPAIEKFAFPLEQQFHHAPLPLKIVYVLNTHNKDAFSVTDIHGQQKLMLLQKNMYLGQHFKGHTQERNRFLQSAKISNQIALARIMRPTEGFQLNELVHLIENDLMKRGLFHAS